MQCQYTLQQLSDLISHGRHSSTDGGDGDTLVSNLQAPSIRQHVAQCDRCQQRLDWLTDDPELHRAAQQATNRTRTEPDVLRRALEVVDKIRSVASTGDTTTDESQPDLSGLLDPPEDSRDLGTVGRYQAQTILGTGGMSVVFAAWDPMLQRRVAIKVFTTSNDAQACKRFVREARAAARIEHRAIVPVYEVIERDGKPPALIMPLMTGGTLQQKLGQESLDTQQAAAIAARIADGLAEMHRRGQVHRDIKPGNILFDLDGQPRLGDFGLVRKHEDEPLTEANVLPGTPEYIAPEMLLENAPASVASDIYQLGLTLYTMLVGVCPYRGTVTNVLRQIVQGPPPKPSKYEVVIPKDLETICLKAIERRPADRYPSADALADDLNRYLRGEPISASRPGIPATAVRWCKRHPVTTAVAGITLPCALMLAVAFAAYLHQSQQSEHFQHQAIKLEEQKNETKNLLADEKVRADVAEKKSEQAFGQIIAGLLAMQSVHEPKWAGLEQTAYSQFALGFEQKLDLIRLDPKRQNDIGSWALNAADFRCRAEQHEQALQLFQIAIDEFDRQLGEQPTDTLWESQMRALRGFGTSSNRVGKSGQAIGHLTRASTIAAKQAHDHPDSLKWQLEAALTETEYGNALAALDQHEQALQTFDGAAVRIDRITAADGSHFDLHNFRMQLADGIAALAQGYQRIGQFERAIELQESAIGQNERMGKGEQSQIRLADSYATLADIMAGAGRDADAEAKLRLAIETLSQVISQSKQPQRYETQLKKWQQLASAK